MSGRKGRTTGMRRSNSTSSIPVLSRESRVPHRTPDHAPKRQASEDRKLQRQGSSSKLTSGRYQQPKIQRQNSGSQLRPSNLQRQNSGSQLRPSHLGGSSSKTTPLQRQNSNSQLRVTASGSSSFSPGARFAKSLHLSSVKKEPRDNKTWQREQQSKVRQFFELYSEIPASEIKAGITLDKFVDLLDTCFGLVAPENKINKANYVESVPKLLKALLYPYPVSGSLMRTANVPHNWPHILSIFGWFADCVAKQNGTYIYADPTLNVREPVSDFEALKMEYFVKSYKAFQNGLDTSHLRAEVVKKTEIMYSVTDEQMSASRKERDRLKEEAEKSMANSSELARSVEKDRLLLAARESVLDDRYAELTKQKREAEKGIEDVKATIAQYIEREKELLTEKQQISEAVATQKYSKEEFLKLKEEEDELMRSQKINEAVKAHRLELISSCDLNLASLKQKIDAMVGKINRKVDELSLRHPELNKMQVRVPTVGFARKDFLGEVANVSQNITEHKKVCLANLKEMQAKLNEFGRQHHAVSKQVSALQETELNLKRKLEQAGTKHHELQILVDMKEMKAKQMEETVKVVVEEKAKLAVKVEDLEIKKVLLEYKQEEMEESSADFFRVLEIEQLKNYNKYAEMMLAAQAQLIQHFTESAQQLDSETAAAEQGIKEKYEKEIKELMHFINCCKMSE